MPCSERSLARVVSRSSTPMAMCPKAVSMEHPLRLPETARLSQKPGGTARAPFGLRRLRRSPGMHRLPLALGGPVSRKHPAFYRSLRSPRRRTLATDFQTLDATRVSGTAVCDHRSGCLHPPPALVRWAAWRACEVDDGPPACLNLGSMASSSPDAASTST